MQHFSNMYFYTFLRYFYVSLNYHFVCRLLAQTLRIFTNLSVINGSYSCSYGYCCGRDTVKWAGALLAANRSLNRSLSTNMEYRDVSAGSRNVIVAGVEVVKPVHATGHRQDVLSLWPLRGWSEW